MQKRMILSSVLIVVLVVLMAACSTNENDSNNGGASNVNNSSSNGETASSGSEKPVNLSLLVRDVNNPYAKEWRDGDMYGEELSKLSGYNMEVQWVDHTNYNELMTLRFASGNLTDIMLTDGIEHPNHPNAIENGVFLELNDLLEEHGQNILNKVDPELWNHPLLSKDGKIYAVPKMWSLPDYRVVYYRQDWLDKLGMNPPETLDDYLAYFEGIKQNDMNGNGVVDDEYGFLVRENLNFSELFFGYFDAYPGNWSLVDGQMIPDIIKPEMKEAVTFWKKMYEEGYVNPDLFTTLGGDWVNRIHSGEAGMFLHQVISPAWELDNFTDPNAELGILPGPVNANGETRSYPKESAFNQVYVINGKTKHPEEAIKMIDWAWSDDPAKDNFFKYGIEGHNYEVVDGKVQFDPNAPENVDKSASIIFQLLLNVAGDIRGDSELIKLTPRKDIVLAGKELAKQMSYDTPSKLMPALDAIKNNPELGDRAGSLFLDMFAKVVIGNDELDTAFDEFVAKWRDRGGDEAIEEATTWYNSIN